MVTSNNKGFTERLADYICSIKYDDLPAEVVQKTKTVIADALACQVACSQLENGRLIIEFGRALGGKAEASVSGSNYKTTAINAALINGTLGHGDEIDDSLEGVGTVSAVTVPAALACGEREGASGKDMITAVVAGYEMGGRLANAGVSVGTLPLLQGMTFAGTFWGTATACNLLKLEPSKTRIALGLACCQAGGYYDLGSEVRHMAKSLACGLSARNGVTSALLAHMDYDGPQSAFDGDQNAFKCVVGANYRPEELTKNLGEKFAIVDTCIKLYCAGHGSHAPAYGMLKILAREGISAEEIRSITTRQPEHEWRVNDNKAMLENNRQYIMAVAAFDRQLTWAQYTPERAKDPQVLDLKSRVISIHDPRLDERKKITKAHSAEVEVETKDGRRFLERVDFPPGDPGNPLSQEDVDKKIMHYASKVLGQQRIQKLIETVKNLEAVGDLNQLGKLLRK